HAVLRSSALPPPTSTPFPYTTLFRSRRSRDAPAAPLRPIPRPPHGRLESVAVGTRRSGRIPADERSVVSTIRGIPAWTAVLLAVAITLSGVAIDSLSGGLGAGFIVAFFLGCLIAALAVARRSVFVAGIQPPIIMAILVP